MNELQRKVSVVISENLRVLSRSTPMPRAGSSALDALRSILEANLNTPAGDMALRLLHEAKVEWLSSIFKCVTAYGMLGIEVSSPEFKEPTDLFKNKLFDL